jgi:hypothetical protein
MTAALPAGGSVTSPSSILTDETTGKDVTLTDSPTVTTNIITQVVRGSELTKNHVYTLVLTFTALAGNPSTILSTITKLTVPA